MNSVENSFQKNGGMDTMKDRLKIIKIDVGIYFFCIIKQFMPTEKFITFC